MSTPSLLAAVQNAYRVFGRRSAPTLPLNVCTGCCMPPELEQEMRSLPLQQLSARHFWEYADGAMGVQPAAEIKYLLPRWLELLAEGHDLRHSIEVTLDRVGCCPADSFTEAERAVLNDFMLAYFDAHMSGQACREGQWYRADDPIGLLLMADYAGLEVRPLLQHWAAMEHPQSTLAFVHAVYWDYLPTGDIGSAFAGDRPAFRALMREWLESPATQAAFTRKLMDADLLARVAQHPPWGHTAIATMVDAVFDHLTL
ncbi:hypothetical protein [Inhella proteolytica]|uniref:Uncharacterized protein n=1 Tax=Inhella proteolytica TaxID=2795029 RepID=A0A931NG11_9BURK|nr:hypothetical protein [Inhella proteolytica]MBH9576676.1 hypothetical protein [Inhella proteolytica]